MRPPPQHQAAEGEEHAEGEHGGLSGLLWPTANFVILCGGLYYFLRTPLASTWLAGRTNPQGPRRRGGAEIAPPPPSSKRSIARSRRCPARSRRCGRRGAQEIAAEDSPHRRRGRGRARAAADADAPRDRGAAARRAARAERARGDARPRPRPTAPGHRDDARRSGAAGRSLPPPGEGALAMSTRTRRHPLRQGPARRRDDRCRRDHGRAQPRRPRRDHAAEPRVAAGADLAAGADQRQAEDRLRPERAPRLRRRAAAPSSCWPSATGWACSTRCWRCIASACSSTSASSAPRSDPRFRCRPKRPRRSRRASARSPAPPSRWKTRVDPSLIGGVWRGSAARSTTAGQDAAREAAQAVGRTGIEGVSGR